MFFRSTAELIKNTSNLVGATVRDALNNVQIDLTSKLTDPGSNGIVARTGIDGATTARTITGGSGISVSNGNGVSGDPTIAIDSSSALGSLRGYLWGCEISNNATDATNDIDFASGICADSTGTVMMHMPAMTKRLDAGWSPGTGGGMRDSNYAIANATYHLFAVCKAGGADPDWYALGDNANPAAAIVQIQSEPGGSAYVYARRVASIIRVSGVIRGFVQTGDMFIWSSPAADFSSSSARAMAALAVGIPVGIVSLPIVRGTIAMTSSSGVADMILQSADGSGSTQILVSMSINGTPGVPPPVFISNTSQQIRMGTNVYAGTIADSSLTTIGYIDSRGRDA